MSDTIVIFDSEWTTWEGAWKRRWSGPGEEREIVQIGMAKLADTPELEEIAHLEFLIKPQINPDLSDYFINLTGITQPMVDDAKIFPDALPRLIDFLDSDVRVVHCFGSDGKVLHHNCQLNELDDPFPAALFVSIIPAVAKFIGRSENQIMSSRLPDYMGFAPPGDAHTALADARCIAEALRIMRRADAF